MPVSRDLVESRREFFRAAGRYSLLGLLALGGALAIRKGPGREQCINDGICAGCGAFANCGLPQALSARQAGRLPQGRSKT